MTGQRQSSVTKHLVADATDAPDRDALVWQGQLNLFAPLPEGGPGRAVTLLITIAISVLGIIWAVLADQSVLADNPLAYVAGIGGGVAILTVSVVFLLRCVFRRRRVMFVLAPDHAEIRSHAAQGKLDAAVNVVADVMTGTWQGQAVPKARVAWGDVKRVLYMPEAYQILVKSRETNLRFHCQDTGRFVRAKAIVDAHVGNRR